MTNRGPSRSSASLVACGLLLAPLTLGCVQTPGDGSAIASRADAVPFSGFAFEPGSEVRIKARSIAGGIGLLGSTRSTTEATVLADGSRIFGFSSSVVIPRAYWTPVPGCELSVAYVSVTELRAAEERPLSTFDEAGTACLNLAVGTFGVPPVAAVAQCGTAEPARVYAGPGHTLTGNVRITSRAAADALRCVTRIDGNLHIEMVEANIGLPYLTEVTGSLSMVGHYLPTASAPAVPTVNLDSLAKVGGSVFLHIERTTLPLSSVASTDFGLNRLGAVGGEVQVLMRQFNAEARGLNRLVQVPGNVTYSGITSGDLHGAELLKQLQVIGGSVTIRGGSTTGSILTSVRRIGGSLLIAGTAEHRLPLLQKNVLPRLDRVSGDVTLLVDSYLPAPLDESLRNLRSLSYIGGRLTIEKTRYAHGRIILPGPLRVRLGLTIRDTQLSTFPLFNAPTTVVQGGIIEVVGNPQLCSTRIAAFAQSQRPSWTGTLAESRNNGGC